MISLGLHSYVLAVACSHSLWRAGRQERADSLVASLPHQAWATLSAGEGSQGERLYDWACIRLSYETGPGAAQWLLARRSLGDPTQVAYFRVFGPATSSIQELARVAGMRWAIEESFEDAKGTAGLDEYEVRKWQAWHRHITLALLAHAYLEVTRRYANEAQKGGQESSSP